MTQAETIVSAQGLSKQFGELTAVNNISFAVKRGEFVGVLGPNGAGKTTTLRMLLGHAVPSSGELSVLGYQLPEQARQMRAHVGVVPQQDNLDPDLSVYNNLKTYASYFGIRKVDVELLIDFAALQNKRDVKVQQLSGGMKRRLILARALVNDPELLILDEPTTGLDPQARQLIWQRLRQLQEGGVTLILTTHYLEEAERLCDRVLVVEKGEILANGTPKQLIEQNIEPNVIEVHGESLQAWYQRREQIPADRVEKVGETVFCYCHDEHALIEHLLQQPQVNFNHRRANLEDVFLKLTGRELRDG